MSETFDELVALAKADPKTFYAVPRERRLAAARAYAQQVRDAVRRMHNEGAAGSAVVRRLSDEADTILRGTYAMARAATSAETKLRAQISLCALGGYGRGELSPCSDLDICLLYEGAPRRDLEVLNRHLLALLFDMGYKVGFASYDAEAALHLAKTDRRAFTTLLESRLIEGDSMVFARVKLWLRDYQASAHSDKFVQEMLRSRYEGLDEEHRDLFTLNPDIKEGAGGLRDFHVALWLFMVSQGVTDIDDLVGRGLLTQEERLELAEALDFLWRVRNELHFHYGCPDDRLTFERQKHVAAFLGYGDPQAPKVSRFMQDYYGAARALRRFLRTAARTAHYQSPLSVKDIYGESVSDTPIVNGELHAGWGDPQWFRENSARLMEVFWRSARHHVPLSHETEKLIIQNLDLVNDHFRSNGLVRQFFLALCNYPAEAGRVLRQMASVGLLQRYIPEWEAIQGIIRYEDFHYYPVDEHTLRALEAIASLRRHEDPVSRCLTFALENLSDPAILVLAILFHDLGKATGDIHVEESVRLTHAICQRIGITKEDEERIVFLVERHTLMAHLSMYRDIDDIETVRLFADTMKTDQRLRELFLLSYADLSAVGPNVWNEWKGALLMKLYLRAERLLAGRAEPFDEMFWESPKAKEVVALTPEPHRHKAKSHLYAMGDRYFLTFTAEQIASHIACVEEALEKGFALRGFPRPDAGMTDVTICTKDRRGLFAMLTGCFASKLIDVSAAALFTRPDGLVVDSFTVSEARGRRSLTAAELTALEEVFHEVLVTGKDVETYVESARRRLFALLQPRTPVRTRIEFDNGSSRTHTVIDIEAADRTGLLYDMAKAMMSAGLDISAARIVTDARRVRDSFYVTYDGAKIEDEQLKENIRDRVFRAIHPHIAADTKGETA